MNRARKKYSALVVLSAAVLYVFIWQCYERLPIHGIVTENADILLIEEVARYLNAGGNLFDWRLTQAPYLFPDIFAARLMAAAGVERGFVAIYYQFWYGLALCGAFCLFAKLAKACIFRTAAATLLLFSLSFIGLLDGDTISLYFGLIGCHSGAALLVLTAVLSIWLGVTRPSLDMWMIPCVFASLFLAAISDSIAIVIVLPGMTLYLWLVLRRKELERAHATTLLWVIAAAVLAGKLFGGLNPFPQDQEFIGYILKQFPHLTPAAFSNFFADLWRYSIHSRISLLLLVLTLWGYATCAMVIAREVKAVDPVAGSPLLPLCLVVIVALPLVLVLQLSLGMYVAIDSSRQWAPIVFLTIIAAVIARLRDISGNGRTFDHLVMLSSVLCCVFLAVTFTMRKGELTATNEFERLAQCMKDKLPSGAYYIADYWLARPTSFYSNGRFGVVPIQLGFGVFTTAANIKAIRNAEPRYAITGLSIKVEEYAAKYGPATASFCKMQFPQGYSVEVLDYSQNEGFKQEMRQKARVAY